MEYEASLAEVLDAREARVQRQRELLARYELPLVSFTLNIAEPVKNSALIQRSAFRSAGV